MAQERTTYQLVLETGKAKIVRRKRSAKDRLEPTKETGPWWNEKGMKTFLTGALVWQGDQAASMAGEAGLSVETGYISMTVAETEEDLRGAYRSARGLRIDSTALVTRLKIESRRIQIKLGSDSGWVGRYLLWNVDLLSEEYKLSRKTRENLKSYANSQIPIPNIN